MSHKAGHRASAVAAPGSWPELLAAKLRIPGLSVATLHRRRLTDLIDQAAGHRVTVVSGPPGAGKTVACASWAFATPEPRRVAWVTLDAADRDPARFWAYVRAALSRAGAGGRLAMPTAAHDGGTPATGDVAALGLAWVQAVTQPTTLVLDDLQELGEDGPVLSGLGRLLQQAPAPLRLILVGRCLPPLQLARLRLSGDLTDLTAADLACNAQEADAYFAMLGLEADPGTRDELLRQTEGWMAGLRLAAMSTAGAGGNGTSGRVASISGTEPLVTDYLRDEVLGRQSPQTRLFMLRTSITEQTSGDLADTLTGEPGGTRVLERLSRENSFVGPAAPGVGAYRYHTLLRAALASELARQLPDEVPVLLRRAARWHAAHDQAIAALRCAAQAGDWDYAAGLLAAAGTSALVREGATALEEVLAVFPAQHRANDAAVAAALAAVRLWNGDPDSASPHLDSAQLALGRHAPAERPVIELWLLALRVMQAASRSQADPGLLARGWAVAEHGQATAATQPERQVLGLLWFALGAARLRRWEIGASRHALRHACLQLTAGGLAELCTRARGWLALAEAWYGDLTLADKTLSELRHDGSVTRPGADPASSCLTAVTSAQVSLARDDLARARKLLDDCGQVQPRGLRLPGEPDLAAVAGLIRARAALADDDVPGAHAIAARLRDTSAPGDPALERLLTLLDCQIAVRAGDTGRARMRLQPVADGPGAERADCRLMLGRLLLSEADFPAAADAVEPVIDGTAAEVTMQLKIAALVVAAVASRRSGRTAAAGDLLQQALALAEPDGACRVFLDEGQPARSAITVLVPPTSRGAGFASRILERFETQLPHGGQLPQQPPAVLTDSELVVLRFLPSHLTNQEIAEELFLSINTVKTHLRAAYRKLGVASRRAAIARARRLGLLLAAPDHHRGRVNAAPALDLASLAVREICAPARHDARPGAEPRSDPRGEIRR